LVARRARKAHNGEPVGRVLVGPAGHDLDDEWRVLVALEAVESSVPEVRGRSGAHTRPAIAPAEDGTTNALGLKDPLLFAPLYGPGSAERFRAHFEHSVSVDRPGLRDDVDRLADLERLAERCGPNTRAALVSV